MPDTNCHSSGRWYRIHEHYFLPHPPQPTFLLLRLQTDSHFRLRPEHPENTPRTPMAYLNHFLSHARSLRSNDSPLLTAMIGAYPPEIPPRTSSPRQQRKRLPGLVVLHPSPATSDRGTSLPKAQAFGRRLGSTSNCGLPLSVAVFQFLP
jgi:hypothetical protein